MHDYVRGGKKKQSSYRPSDTDGFFRKVLKIIGSAVGGLLLLILVFRSISWSKIFSLTETQTILFATKSVEQQGMLLARFYADETKIEVITLDPNAEIEVVGGYGTYRAQAMYPLLALEGKSDQFIRASLGLTLKMILDRTVVIKEGNIEIDQSASAFKSLLWRSIKDSSTSLSFWERIQFAALLLDTKTSIDVYEQSSSDFKLLEKDFSTSYLVGNTGLGCSVALVNTTQTSGLARKLDNLLASDKIYVVRTINGDSALKKTHVSVSKEQKDNHYCKLVLSKLSKVVPDGFEKKFVPEKELQQYRADVVVEIGQDLSR